MHHCQLFFASLFFLLGSLHADETALSLDIISYQDFVSEDPQAMETLKTALLEKGIVGIRAIPGYKEKVMKFIETAREFNALSDEAKEAYAPKENEIFLGYEKGKEKFKRPDGTWVVDDLKISYYGMIPDCQENKWPSEVDLRNAFQEMGELMAKMGTSVMKKIGLVGPETGIEDLLRCGRMLYYKKNSDSSNDNPYWCGAHFDHGLFTALLPAFYYVEGEQVTEPDEAGLFVKAYKDDDFKKVVANDPDVLLFQVGEFGQVASNDAIRATEHRVHKASGNVERYTMALFITPTHETVIRSTSVLTQDERYGGQAGDLCRYGDWHEASFKRYIVR